MRMRHSISMKLPVIKCKILNPPKGTHKEFAISNFASTARFSKEKSSKKSFPGIGKPLPSKSKVTSVPQKQQSVTTGDEEGPTSTNIPAVPVLRSPLPYGLCVHHTPPPSELLNMSVDNAADSDKVSGSEVILNTAANAACGALVSVPIMRAGTPKVPSRPGSALAQGLPWSVPLTHPLSSAATPLATAVNNTSVISGPSAPPRQMS